MEPRRDGRPGGREEGWWREGSPQGLRRGTAFLTSLLTQIFLSRGLTAHTFQQLAPLGMGREDISPNGALADVELLPNNEGVAVVSH